MHVCYGPCILEASVCLWDPWFFVAGSVHVASDWNYLHGVCVGQAANPGPWALEVRNIVSASKHIEDFRFQADCHVWTETTATKNGQGKILKQMRKRATHVVFSAPAPSKQSGGPDVVGRPVATGTLCMSKARSTSLEGHWEGPVFTTGRVSDSLLQLPGHQVRVIAVYGFHSGIVDSVAKNDKLFSQVFHMASGFKVPVIIAGDFNCDLNELSSWQAAVSRGFVDVAARSATLMGCEPDPTYKGTSRLDYIVCNEVAARAFQTLMIDPCGYTDHATLTATFDWQTVVDRIPTWTFPRSFDAQPAILQTLADQSNDPAISRLFQSALEQEDVDQALVLFAKHFEHKCAISFQEHHHHDMPSAYRGRARGKIVLQAPQSLHGSSEQSVAQAGVGHRQKSRVLQWVCELHTLSERHPGAPKCVILWELIFNSKGFRPTFPRWLLDNDIVPYIPYDVPDISWLKKVKEALQFESTLWQAHHLKHQRANIARCMQDDWHKGGRLHSASVKPVPLGTLDSLSITRPRTFQLLRARKGELAQIRFTDGVVTPPDACLIVGTAPASRVVRVLRDSPKGAILNCSTTSDLQHGTAQQISWTTDTQYIAGKVQDFWQQYWQPTAAPDLDSALSLLEGLPQIPTFEETITPAEVELVIRQLPARKARGMDGFSNTELRACGPAEYQMLADIFNLVHRTGKWPTGLLSAFVSLLAKVAHPSVPKDGRPITILPTLYRVWAKIISKKIFAAIVEHLPVDIFGSVPGRSAMDAAWELQCQLEEALAADGDLVGVSLDLSKAYNTIPRDFICALARRCGWPESIIGAYMAYLNSFQRFFKLHGGFHAPTLSRTGVPEGCPIAVPVMIMLTWAVTAHVTHQLPDTRMLSYVDNWTLTAGCLPDLQQQMDRMLWSTRVLGLLLNPQKTRAFATNASLRAQLARVSFAGCSLQVHQRHDDLGVVFTSTHQVQSSTLHARLQANESKMQKLRIMPWSATRKQQVLLRTILPALTYGVSFASSPMTYLATLRGKMSAAVWGKHHHRDHFLAPLMGSALPAEPFLLIFRIRLADMRRAVCRAATRTTQQWNAALLRPRSSGPLHYFHQFCRLVGIQPQLDLLLQFPDGSTLHVGASDRRAIMIGVEKAWFQQVAAKVTSKLGLQDLDTVDFHWSQRLRKATKVPLHILGAFVSNAALQTGQKIKFLSETESRCRYCGAADTSRHRLLECEHFAPARQGLPVSDMQQWPALLLERGLHRLPISMQRWDEYLQALPWPPLDEIFDEKVHLFTDGSTASPHSVPVSAWSVIVLEESSFEAVKVAAGVVPGHQTNYRAELFAVMVAIASAECATVYIDNSAVLRGVLRLQSQGWISLYWEKQPEYELWWQVWSLFRQKVPAAWSFRHVKSHRQLCADMSAFDRWTWHGNEGADKAAKQANSARSADVLQLHRQACHAWYTHLQRARAVAALQEGVLKGSSSQGSARSPGSVPSGLGSSDLQLGDVLPSLHLTEQAEYPDALLGPRFIWMLHQWWMSQSFHACPAGYSVAELYMCFAEQTGWMSPQNLAKWPPESLPFRWRTAVQTAFVAEVDYEGLSYSEVSFSKQLTVFLHALKFFAQRQALDLRFDRRPVLDFVDSFEPVATICCAPGVAVDMRSEFIRRSGHCWKRFKSSPYRPQSSPKECPIAVVHPLTTWNRYYARRKSLR